MPPGGGAVLQLVKSTPGLTANEAPFIETARQRGRFVHPPAVRVYSAANHRTWRGSTRGSCRGGGDTPTSIFCAESSPWRLPPDRVPRLEEVNRFLHPLTGFEPFR